MNASTASDIPSVLITGCSSGIGWACARELDQRGYRVFAGVRREQDADQLRKANSSRLTPLILDITDSAAVSQATEQIADQIDAAGLVGLVNNAGISVACPLEFLPIEQLRRQFEVNLFGHLAVTQAMLPLLRASRGRIVNISSLSGLTAGPYVGAYAASKFALEALSDSLRVEIRRFGVSVSLVEPADIDTPIWEKSQAMADDLRDDLVDQAMEKLPEEVQEVYREDITAMRTAADGFAEHALPVERVVRAVMHALSSRRPKTRYRVGAKTYAVAYLLRQLPDRLRDRIVVKSLGMR